MEKLKFFFDDFTFHARVMPVLVLVTPFVIIALLEGIVKNDWQEYSIGLFICVLILVFTSKIARNLGKAYEEKMYKELGGMPTTIVQRFSDNTFDEITKKRYHTKMNSFEGLSLPIDASEECSKDDMQYCSATNILRTYANQNRQSEPRVYQELKEYNFWRNLYGSRVIALIIYVIFLIREIIISPRSFLMIFVEPITDYLSIIVLATSILIVLLCVNQNIVKRKAFDYARTLIEVCERIPVCAGIV